MSKTFNPRSVPADAWKTWNKDAFKTIRRLGVGWGMLWLVCLPGLAWALVSYLGAPGWGLMLGYVAALFAGALAQPLLAHAVDRAANGQPPSPVDDAMSAALEISGNPSWLRSSLIRQAVGVVIFVAIILVFALLAMAAPVDPDQASKEGNVWTVWDGASSMLSFFVWVPTVFRRGGMMGFNYYLELRHSLPGELADALNEKARMLNASSLMAASLLLIGSCMLISNLSVLALLLYPIAQLHHAAVLRCAYHDIFEGGTGVKEKVVEKVPAGMAAIPA